MSNRNTSHISPTPQEFLAAASRAGLPLTPELAFLLACPLDADPFTFSPPSSFFAAGISSSRLNAPTVADAAAEFAASHGKGTRDLSASPRHWVGWYRSGVKLYSVGMRVLFGLPELVVPADLAHVCEGLVKLLSERPALTLLTRSRLEVAGVELRLIHGATPYPHIRVIPASPISQPVSPESLDGTPIEVAHSLAAELAASLGASLVVMPVESGERYAAVEAALTLPDGAELLVPIEVAANPPVAHLGPDPLHYDIDPLAPLPRSLVDRGFVALGRGSETGRTVAYHHSGFAAWVMSRG